MNFEQIIAGGRESLVNGGLTHFNGRIGDQLVTTLSCHWDSACGRLRATITYCWTGDQLATEFSVEHQSDGQSVYARKFGDMAIDYTVDQVRARLIGDGPPENLDQFRAWDAAKNDHDAEIAKTLKVIPALPSGYPFI